MSNLIKADLFKLTRNKTFWVLIMIITAIALGLTLCIFMASKGILNLNLDGGFSMAQTEAEQSNGQNFKTSGLETFIMTMGGEFSIIILLISVLAGFFISQEYSTGVIKNIVAGGNSRGKIFCSKLIVYSIGVVIISLVYPIITTISTTLMFGFGELPSTSPFIYILRSSFLTIINFIAIGSIIMLFAIIVEESGKTIGISIGFIIFINVFFGLGQNIEVIKVIYEYSVFYQILEASNPIMTNIEVIKSLLIGVVTFIIVTYFGVFVFGKKDIK
ncbi:ABC transporter permease [Bacillus paramycoides]|uniref:ABC transporter permease n=1 Tax=Bacillus paramycoides TaxID=2026194 RepID=UPI003D00D1EF